MFALLACLASAHRKPVASVAVNLNVARWCFRSMVTVTVGLPGGMSSKVAVTDWSEFIATVQVPLPEQPAPDQPANEEPDAGIAVSVTVPPAGYEREQVEPQLICPSVEVTVPTPEPDLATVSMCCVWGEAGVYTNVIDGEPVLSTEIDVLVTSVAKPLPPPPPPPPALLPPPPPPP